MTVKASDRCRVIRVRPEIAISQLLLVLQFYYFMLYGYLISNISNAKIRILVNCFISRFMLNLCIGGGDMRIFEKRIWQFSRGIIKNSQKYFLRMSKSEWIYSLLFKITQK